MEIRISFDANLVSLHVLLPKKVPETKNVKKKIMMKKADDVRCQ
jgi:hypothetical protein